MVEKEQENVSNSQNVNTLPTKILFKSRTLSGFYCYILTIVTKNPTCEIRDFQNTL